MELFLSAFPSFRQNLPCAIFTISGSGIPDGLRPCFLAFNTLKNKQNRPSLPIRGACKTPSDIWLKTLSLHLLKKTRCFYPLAIAK